MFDLIYQINRLRVLLRRKTPQLTSMRVEPGIPEIKCLRFPRKCALEIRLTFRGYTPRVGAFIEGDGGYSFPCFVGQVRYLRGHFSLPPQCGRAEMVWPITGAKSYVCETGKSIKAVELAVSQKGCWRKIPITLTDQRSKREIGLFTTAGGCEDKWGESVRPVKRTHLGELLEL